MFDFISVAGFTVFLLPVIVFFMLSALLSVISHVNKGIS